VEVVTVTENMTGRADLARLQGAELAAAGFLARYGGATRVAYALDLRTYFGWCAQRWVDPLAVTRPIIELYVRWLEEERRLAPATVGRRLGTVCCFFRFAVIDGLLASSPAEYVRRPKRPEESNTQGITHLQFEALLARSREHGPVDHAVIVLLGMLGLRVGEACAANIHELGMVRGHRVLLVHGKGSKDAFMPLPPAVARAIDLAVGARGYGPILTTRTGRRMDRHAASRVVKRTARTAGITQRIHPHVLRHAFVTTMLDAGVPLRDVQIAARHADPRTTTRYDRARANLDRHAVYILAAFMAGAT
jgi:integrase/recombinase XerD